MSEYQAARQLVELNCIYCNKTHQVDAQDQESVESSKEWIMIVPSDGTKLAVCSKEHGVHFLNGHRKPQIEIVRS